MRMSFKIMAGLAVAGIAATAGSAFTATGLATTGTAGSAQFVGGTISQSVTGATISTITYDYADTTNKLVNEITLTFTGGSADGKAVTAVPTDDGSGGGVGSGGTFECPVVADNESICTFNNTNLETGYTGLESLAVTVSNPS